MTFPSKNRFPLPFLGATLSAVALVSGCGGGGGGSTAPVVPSPFDAAYKATFKPSNTIPADGQAPSGSLEVVGGKASLQARFFLQPSVVTAVQKAIDDGLRSNNVGGSIPDNQVPQNIAFAGSGQLDGNGKVVLTSRRSVDICGSANLTIDPTFTAKGTSTLGTGTYQITFPNTITVVVRGQKFSPKPQTGGVPFTCNNLPLRSGSVTFTR